MFPLMNRPTALLASCLLLAGPAGAGQPPKGAPSAPLPPAAEEARKVIAYYYGGKDQGPVLVELKPCLKTDSGKESPTKNECVEPVAGPVKKGTIVHAWTLWMVPDGGSYDDVALQFAHEGQVRTTVDIQLTTSLRSRTWRSSALTKKGKWEIRVVRAGKVIASAPVTVTD